MDFRNLSQEYRVTCSERGVALFTAMTLLVLVSGFAFFVLRNATTEMQISNMSNKTYNQTYAMESGIEQALAWFANSEESPDPDFFKNRACNKSFSHWIEEIGETLEFQFYKPVDGICTLVVASASSGNKMSVDLTENPMPKIEEGISSSPDFREMDQVRRLAKRFGRYLVVSKEGSLKEHDIDIGTFDHVFKMSKESPDMPLIFIDVVNDSRLPLKIGKEHYHGYFYFDGDLEIEGGTLVGFLYTRGKMTLNDPFSVYGALYAGSSFEGHALDVRHNKDYAFGFKGMLPLIPILGSQKTM